MFYDQDEDDLVEQQVNERRCSVHAHLEICYFKPVVVQKLLSLNALPAQSNRSRADAESK